MNLDIKLDVNQIFDKAVEALAKAMHIAEEQLLPILAKQMFIEGVYGIIICLCTVLVSVLIVKSSFSWKRKADEKDAYGANSEERLFGLAIVIVLAFIVSGVTLFAEDYLLTSVTKAFNPEYAMIQEVVKMAKDLIGNK